jgi:hypothetical protein
MDKPDKPMAVFTAPQSQSYSSHKSSTSRIDGQFWQKPKTFSIIHIFHQEIAKKTWDLSL